MGVAEGNSSASIDWEAARETYKRDGVVHLSQVLGADALQAALKALRTVLGKKAFAKTLCQI